MDVLLSEQEHKEFITVDTWYSALYDEFSSSLNVKYWERLIPQEEFAEFGEYESFINFEEMLNYIEKYTPYTLFTMIPYKTGSGYNKIKLIYVKK